MSWRWWIGLLLSAAVLLWPLAGGGLPAGAELALEGWIAVARHGPGLALVHTPDAAWPIGADLVARRGYPLEAALLWPLLAALPLPLALALGTWLWLSAAGLAAAWLGARWWGRPAAGLVTGLCWQAVWAGAAPDRIAGAALLPAALSLSLAALERPLWRGAAAGGALGGLAGICWAPAGWAWGAALLAALALSLAGGSRRAPWIAGAGGGIAALAVGAPVLGWTLSHLWLVAPAAAGARWPLAAGLPLAAAGWRLARRQRRRRIVPAALVALGVALASAAGTPLDPLADLPRVETGRAMVMLVDLGCALLAGGLALRGRWWPGACGLALAGGLAQSPRPPRAWPALPPAARPALVLPLEAGMDPAVRAALGVPVINPPSATDPVGRWLEARWPEVLEEEGAAGLGAAVLTVPR